MSSCPCDSTSCESFIRRDNERLTVGAVETWQEWVLTLQILLAVEIAELRVGADRFRKHGCFEWLVELDHNTVRGRPGASGHFCKRDDFVDVHRIEADVLHAGGSGYLGG